VHAAAFWAARRGGEFKFMSSEVSREKPIDYALMARLLVDERERGGARCGCRPALVHSRRGPRHGRGSSAKGFVGAFLAGNAVAGARHRGVDLRHHARHEAAPASDRGRARAAHAAPSTRCAPRGRSPGGAQGVVRDGIMHALVERACRSCSAARSATTARSPT
jgi:hypothetical protein